MSQTQPVRERRSFLAQFVDSRLHKFGYEWEQVLDRSEIKLGDVVFDSGPGCYYAGRALRTTVVWFKAKDNTFEFPIRATDIANGHIWKQVPWEDDDDA